MKHIALAALSALIPLTAACVRPPEAREGPSTQAAYVADARSWITTSAATGRTYQISVALPDEYATTGAPYPVLYAVDANAEFGTVVETARHLRLENLVPDLVIVGVGYPGALQGWKTSFAPRAVDLTPTVDAAWVKSSGELFGPMRLPAAEGSGGADGFLRFLREELIPKVEASYHVSHEGRALFGHSFGGLFGVHALLTGEGTFARYIIGSPSLWWDKGVSLAREEAYARGHTALPARVFLSVGLLEETWQGEPTTMVSNVRAFSATLERRRYEGLELRTHLFDDETHTSVVPATISRGLRFIYESRAATPERVP